MTDRIELKGIQAIGTIGVLPEEQERAQPFEVDITVESDLSQSGQTDSLNDTVNYAEVTEAIVTDPNLRDEPLPSPCTTNCSPSLEMRAVNKVLSLPAAFCAINGVQRIRFTSPHPKDLRREVIEAMASTAAVCEHLHFPLQSGSDRILAAMHRGYNRSKYLERLNEARQLIPDLAVTQDPQILIQ